MAAQHRFLPSAVRRQATFDRSGQMSAEGEEHSPDRDSILKLLPEPLAAQLAVEGAGAAFVEAAVERLAEIGEGGAGDVGEVEVQRLVERRPDELDQLGLGMDGAFDPPGD